MLLFNIKFAFVSRCLDPCLALSKFADEQAASSVSVISIGEGEQVGHASRAIRTAAKRGGWVILQNCHLIKTWPRKFMKEIMVNKTFPFICLCLFSHQILASKV